MAKLSYNCSVHQPNTSTLPVIFVSIDLSRAENPSKGGGILIAYYGRVLYVDYFLQVSTFLLQESESKIWYGETKADKELWILPPPMNRVNPQQRGYSKCLLPILLSSMFYKKVSVDSLEQIMHFLTPLATSRGSQQDSGSIINGLHQLREQE